MSFNVRKPYSTGNIFVDLYFLRKGNLCRGNYPIKGLCDFLDSGHAPKNIEIPENVARDLRSYREFCRRRKKIWEGEGDRGSKLGRVRDLSLELGTY